jgi:hypothetical protein
MPLHILRKRRKLTLSNRMPPNTTMRKRLRMVRTALKPRHTPSIRFNRDDYHFL